MTLKEFRERLQLLMRSEFARPFTCDGSPLECRIFVVGLNSATRLENSFFTRYWCDSQGFDRSAFESDYQDVRTKRGVRPRIEAFVRGAHPLPCLETNIYSVPTKKASHLRPYDKDPSIIEFLLKEITPAGILIHSNEPIRYFQELVGPFPIDSDGPAQVELYGHLTHIWGLSGPLFRRKSAYMEQVGAKMKECIGAY